MQFLLAGISVIACTLLLILYVQLRAARRREASLELRIQQLSRFASIPDVEAFVAALREQGARDVALASEASQRTLATAYEQAERASTAAAAEARAAIDAATQAANRVVADATANSERLRREADTNLAEAALASQQIIKDANTKAELIAGEALAAIQNAKAAEQTARALKNVIEGYGDAYIIPTHDLLDELGDSFGHAEAGERLKATRSRMREMIKNGEAADCDYVEENRKTTAIDFVLDAFNGKVATVLADTRDDNHGTLAQKIRDAYALVNHNGKAFRNARITSNFLDVRLEELRWAVALHELKAKEREEQRVLKERIREEERAQREFERALKEAEKEEDALRKAMEKAQSSFDKASDAQKAKYEDQLRDLAERLKVAEEKGKRALSMAQQTKSGHVYVISNVGSFGEDVYKIGLTRRLAPLDRIKELGDASVPFDFDVHALIPCDDAPALENAIHKVFLRKQVNKVNARKEFFRVSLDEIRRQIEETGSDVAWTMTAECRQYRETQAIERAMKDKSFSEKAWAEQQLKQHTQASLEREDREVDA